MGWGRGRWQAPSAAPHRYRDTTCSMNDSSRALHSLFCRSSVLFGNCLVRYRETFIYFLNICENYVIFVFYKGISNTAPQTACSRDADLANGSRHSERASSPPPTIEAAATPSQCPKPHRLPENAKSGWHAPPPTRAIQGRRPNAHQPPLPPELQRQPTRAEPGAGPRQRCPASPQRQIRPPP